ncbi:hypothetical protein BB560_002636 [Smittium megazygosporum]|uniref:Uncharacterized protein n=1 Tax=Smittium megazygosporum TaxID=133381 RepID=A0A2T9YXR5_9FUNG|nr:hypothetical protein BB560_005759 [Smittium megazygosporum]PVV02896.1 hypothetical protein BB560_002636 [Smittium megazygosporum]
MNFLKTNSILKQISTRAISKFIRPESTFVNPARNVNPAYEEALKIIDNYHNKCLENIKKLESQLKDCASSEERESIERQILVQSVESERHFNEVKWNARNRNFDLSKPVYRALKEEAFRKRPLEVVMQRAYQMFVIPDLIDPSKFESASAQLDLTFDSLQDDPIESGIIIQAEKVVNPPKINFIPFHTDSKLYTILLVDPDSPDQQSQSFKQKCHFAACNVPFDIYNNKYDPETMGEVAISYIPPHPEDGTKIHRYVYLVLKQGKNGNVQINPSDIPKTIETRSFCEKLDLSPVAVTFFRSEWDPSVDLIHTNILKETPPRFGSYAFPKKTPKN